MTDSNDKVVTTIEQVKEEVIHQEQQPTTTATNISTESFTENSKTSSSDDKTFKNDIDFSIVDALPPQLNKSAESEEALKPVEKDAKVTEESDKEKDDKLPFSQLFRYASPIDKLFIILGRISFRIYNY